MNSEGGPLDERLARLRAAVDAAVSIGLEQEGARTRTVARRIARRAGFGGAVYVMALAGGTGVGKSSVLNALAGEEVSPAKSVRPTTDAPVAWVPADQRDELDALLDWLKVGSVVTHDGGGLDDVAILDLPDIDSVRVEHRATVDALLPRIDAVTWVVDPEKYDDHREHAYWRSLVPHADRLRFVLNKADRLTDADAKLVADDLRARLIGSGIPRPQVHVVSAVRGTGIEGLREALADAGHAKVIIATKLETDRAAAAERLGRAVGLDADEGYRPLLSEPERERRTREAIDGALELVDLGGLARQIRGAVMHRARVGGGSFLGRLLALASSFTGRRGRRADPGAYLRAWRSRGAIGRVLNPLRAAMVEAAAGLPASSRGRVLQALGAPSAEADVARVIDRAVAEAGALEIPRSPLWPVVGAVQVVVGAVLLFAVAWMVVLFISGGGVPVATVSVPVLGPIPMPLALLTASVLISALLGWLLGLHAGWVGRRLSADVGSRVSEAIREGVVRDAFGGLERVEEARRVIAAAADIG
ncbi:MAG TPA: GTPase domain-containing protein [Candidatus Limnocylindria bacterium]|nr:GTPase domain-containing protein [Candidatus Limnocylindria bacterium]